MKELFYMGGPLVLGILTTLLVIMVAIAIYFSISIASGKASEKINFRHQLTYLKSVGLFTMISTLYGIIIYLFSILIWFLLDLWYNKNGARLG